MSFWGFWRYILDRHKPYLNSNTNSNLWAPPSRVFEASEGILLIGISHTWTVTLTLICEHLRQSFWGFWRYIIDRHKPYLNSNTNSNLWAPSSEFWGFWRYIIDRHKPYLNSNTNSNLWVPSSQFLRLLKYIIDRHKPYLNSNTNPNLWAPPSEFLGLLKVYYW